MQNKNSQAKGQQAKQPMPMPGMPMPGGMPMKMAQGGPPQMMMAPGMVPQQPFIAQ